MLTYLLISVSLSAPSGGLGVLEAVLLPRLRPPWPCVAPDEDPDAAEAGLPAAACCGTCCGACGRGCSWCGGGGCGPCGGCGWCRCSWLLLLSEAIRPLLALRLLLPRLCCWLLLLLRAGLLGPVAADAAGAGILYRSAVLIRLQRKENRSVKFGHFAKISCTSSVF